MMWTSLLLVVMIIAGLLGLRLVPKRWDSVDLKVRPWGLTVSADSDPEDPE
ncbi:hypothetical protein [Halorussus lipolyticus]|uniref:hypothetical protein n=1 Tax=Halorussus lipolyticus TaxID=3034024 RepID=UPI0023E81DA5|nr:hypothetical protein [Halorussus sp. DT80]